MEMLLNEVQWFKKFEDFAVITVSKILYGIRMGLPPESFQILPPLFHKMTEVGHILAKLAGGVAPCHSIYF